MPSSAADRQEDQSAHHPRPPGATGPMGRHRVSRVGLGAMQLNSQVSDDEAIAVLRKAQELGVNHIDTASFYHHGVVNRRIRAALAPYPDDLVIVSKVGARPTTEGPIPMMPAQRPEDLRAGVEADLTQLGIDRVPVVNLRRLDIGPVPPEWKALKVDLDDQMAEMTALRDEGKIGAIGLSNVSLDVLDRAAPAGILCVQNRYNVLDRSSEAQLEYCATNGIAWVPFFPLGSAFGGGTRLTDHPTVIDIAAQTGCTPAQVGIAWLLAHNQNTLVIAGTRSTAHLADNIAAAEVALSQDAMDRLDALGFKGEH